LETKNTDAEGANAGGVSQLGIDVCKKTKWIQAQCAPAIQCCIEPGRELKLMYKPALSLEMLSNFVPQIA
jgi:hypothetical protein